METGLTVHFFRPGSPFWTGTVTDVSDTELTVRDSVTGKLHVVPKSSRWLSTEPPETTPYVRLKLNDDGTFSRYSI